MKKVIDGRLYNTESARELASWEPNPYRSDFSWFCETLYRTKTGRYFLHGEGGPASRYSRTVGQNEWCGGEKIVPLGDGESDYGESRAMAWVEEHCSGDVYEDIFGKIDEEESDGEGRQLNVRLTGRDWDRLREIKEQTGKSYTEIVHDMIRAWQE